MQKTYDVRTASGTIVVQAGNTEEATRVAKRISGESPITVSCSQDI
jgi:hypothetical protein